MRVSEICVKRIRVNQGLGVFNYNKNKPQIIIKVKPQKTIMKSNSAIEIEPDFTNCHQQLHNFIKEQQFRFIFSFFSI